MAFPKDFEIEIPLLKVLKEAGRPLTPQEAIPRVCAYFPALTTEDLAIFRPSGKERKWDNMVRWARQRLVDRGAIDGSIRSMWGITDMGRTLVEVAEPSPPLPPSPRQACQRSRLPAAPALSTTPEQQKVTRMEMALRYGCNPHQTPARLRMAGDAAPLSVLNGRPGYINMLDALGAWQLVHELRQATGLPSAASFKHTSPAGAAVARPLTETFRQAYLLPDIELSPLATAYARARGGDRVSSYGDAVAVSDRVDLSLAQFLQREVSDLIIAPDYDPDAFALLKTKKNGSYLILQIDPTYVPPEMESRAIFGLTLQQKRNSAVITRDTFRNVVTSQKQVPDDVLETLLVATVALKYTQSNSVCVAYDGQVIGMGAGQQSRIHCTRLACDKADKWFLQQHPRVLGARFQRGVKRVDKFNLIDQYLMREQLSQTEEAAMLAGFATPPEPLTSAERAAWIAQYNGICLSSDAFIPFRDNVDRASRSHVQYIAQTGGGLRDAEVIAAAEQYGMIMMLTGLRLFLH